MSSFVVTLGPSLSKPMSWFCYDLVLFPQVLVLSQIEGYGSFINSSDFDKAIVLKLVFKLIILGDRKSVV